MSNKFARKENIRSENKFIFIFSEGEETERIYFESKKKEVEQEIRRKNIKIEIIGTGHNTLSLVNLVINYVERNNIDLAHDECWVVFDKDEFLANFDNAIVKAEANKLKVAYSNESFELWFLLHFSLMNSAIGRNDYIEKLNIELMKISKAKNYKYSKNDDIYPLIKNLESTALSNAKKLFDSHKDQKSFLQKNPSTTVHLLVESLNSLKG